MEITEENWGNTVNRLSKFEFESDLQDFEICKNRPVVPVVEFGSPPRPRWCAAVVVVAPCRWQGEHPPWHHTCQTTDRRTTTTKSSFSSNLLQLMNYTIRGSTLLILSYARLVGDIWNKSVHFQLEGLQTPIKIPNFSWETVIQAGSQDTERVLTQGHYSLWCSTNYIGHDTQPAPSNHLSPMNVLIQFWPSKFGVMPLTIFHV